MKELYYLALSMISEVQLIANSIVVWLWQHRWLTALVIVFTFAALLAFPYKRVKSRWRVAKSRALIKKLRKGSAKYSDPQQLSYLRNLDPYLFEELLLTALERRGYKVIRSKRYSGDGGVDGRFIYNGNLVLIQAKRYKAHIKLEHVKDFVEVVRQNNAAKGGLFIHTGRTGSGVREAVRGTNVGVISGNSLLGLIRGERVAVYGYELIEEKH